jgi:DNA-binding transcriptional ArsR family regulator
MVLALQERMENVAIYNPYWGFVEQFLSNTRFLKRDVDKYNGILKVITCLNGFNRKLHVDDDGNKTLFTTNDDVSIFLDLLERYYESITVNLSPAASDLLEELRKNSDLWGLNDEGMTVNKYVEESDTKISKRSIRQYFRELNDQGLVTVIKKDQRSNVYVLNKSSDIMMNRDFKLDDLDIEILKFNYDIDDFSIYEGSTFLDTPLGDISSNPNPPLWNRYLLEARQRRGDAVQQSIKGVVDGKFDIDLDEEFDGF